MDKKISIKQLLKDFDVDSEDELHKKLSQESITIPCIVCGKEKSIDEIIFKNGDPYCTICLSEKED